MWVIPVGTPVSWPNGEEAGVVLRRHYVERRKAIVHEDRLCRFLNEETALCYPKIALERSQIWTP